MAVVVMFPYALVKGIKTHFLRYSEVTAAASPQPTESQLEILP